MKNTLGTLGTRRKLTGQFRFTPTGESGAINVGNVTMSKRDAKADKTSFTAARKGYTQTIGEEIANLEDRYQVKCNEHGDFNLQVSLFADRGADHVQTETPGVTGQITGAVQGRDYFIGARNITGLMVADGNGTQFTEGEDYTVDLGSGVISILPGGGIDATDLALTFDMPDAKYAVYTSNPKKMTRTGTVDFLDFDQQNEADRTRHTFPATLSMSDRGESDGKKETEQTFDLLITGKVVSEERIDN